MNQDVLALTSDSMELIGTLMIAYAALSVHHRVRHEHTIDNKVFTAMQHEMVIAIFGIALLVGGFALRVVTVVVS
jgi:hypothetical protein